MFGQVSAEQNRGVKPSRMGAKKYSRQVHVVQVIVLDMQRLPPSTNASIESHIS